MFKCEIYVCGKKLLQDEPIRSFQVLITEDVSLQTGKCEVNQAGASEKGEDGLNQLLA